MASHRLAGGIRLALAALAVVGAAACGGGGSSPTAPTGSISFQPDRAAGASSVSLRLGARTTSTHLELELVANQLTGVSSVSTVVGHPSDLLRFTGAAQGTFLTQGGAIATVVTTALPAPFQGLVVIDARDANLPGASGSGVIYSLGFDALAAGSGRITLASTDLRDAANRPILGIDGIGGTVTVVR